ncbi:putative tRNA methyltransferase 9B [Amphibalanus amphitrite]|uniref:Putative tRNA methyltransferase 9B n=1 Tax=Amphibalanus amphitrite TaxID=1232801 RepID=A0A6A4X3W3_AMPAM|nr:putative tRNA methyltransferase 9B [Amphibalanus amphitrite]
MPPLEEADEAARRDREARSLALEKTYVHDVYRLKARQFTESRHRPWPRVRQFLAELEPGSLVCDVASDAEPLSSHSQVSRQTGLAEPASVCTGLTEPASARTGLTEPASVRTGLCQASYRTDLTFPGCGDGKYLTLNADAFFIGGDHCERLAAAAAQRTRQQVVVCDALSLPFRDESVDAAVSVAVIHHLATTERRVRALRELARVLRIGGRLIVTVWAMEQRARKFESQDVLVPWDQSQSQSSSDQTSAAAEPDVTSTASEEDLLAYNAFTQNSDSDSTRSSRFLSRRATRRPRRVRAIDPKLPSSSQSSSDLSSPSESCYSFVRRALQKLARRGEIGAGRPRSFSPWPETSDAKPDAKADAKPAEDDDQLIEIRLDDDVSALEESTIANRGVPVAGQLATFKSHSVGDVWSLLAALRGAKRPDGTEERRGEAGRTSLPTDRPRSCPFDSVGLDSTQRRQIPARSANRKSVTFSTQSLTLPRDRPPPSDVVTAKSKSDSVLDARVRSCELLRAALSTVPETREAMDEAREVTDEAREAGDETRTRQKPALVRQQRCEEAVRRLSEAEANAVDTRIGRLTGKQSSLNENLIHSDRLLEREKLQSEIVKQRSLNDSYLYGKLENAETMPQDGFLASYKRLKIIRDSLGKLSESLEKIAENEPPTSSLKNGFVKMVRNWTDGGTAHAEHTDSSVDEPDPQTTDAECPESSQSSSETCRVPDPPPIPPVPVQVSGPAANPDRSNAPPADLSAKPVTPATGSRIERRAMYRFASRERRTSKEESSDSSKENSFQSDTSLDSEDSCVSVIFVPKRETATNAVTENGVKPRSCSVSTTNNSFRKSSAPPPADSVNNNVQVKLDAAAAAGALLDRRCMSSAVPSRSAGAARVELVTAAPVSALALQPSGGLEVVRRPGVQGLRAAGRAAPAFLTFEVFHPETDDLDSESSCGSSSDSSACSVLSQLADWPSSQELLDLDRDIELQQQEQREAEEGGTSKQNTRPPLSSKTSSAETLEPADRAAAGTAAAASAGSVGSEFRSASPNKLVSVDRVPAGPPSTTGRPPVTLSGGPEPRDAPGSGSGPTALSSVIDESAPRAESSVGADTAGEDPGRAAVTAVEGNSDAAEIDDVAKGGVVGTAVRSEECSGESGGSGVTRCDPEQPAAVSGARCRRKVTLARLDAPPLERVAEEAETAAVRRRPVSSLGSASSMSEAETSRPPALAAARASSLSSSSAGSVGRRAPSLATARASPSSPWSSGSSVSDGLRAPSLATGRGSLTSTLSSASSLWTSDGSRAGHSHSWGSSRSTSDGATSLTEPSGAESPAGRPAADSATTARRIFDQAEADAAAAEVAAAAAAAAASEGSPEEADSQEASSEGSPRPDQGGTFGHHRYYHVFREGELDRLISKYVDNLHIISSYYDHANWCVVAEKVQVWTI